ncbi:MAG TPA: phosphatase PAP2 family protein [Myxococcota bacterium]|nr:phosphatase PAP2 family protein [Myxococcota bacterium]
MASIEGEFALGARVGLGERLLSHGGAKLRLFAGLTVGICVPYFTLQRVQLFRPFTPPALALDAAVSFLPAWIWAYASLFALVPLSAALSATRADVAAFGRALVWLCVPSFLFFLLAPSAGPRPPEAGAAAELGWLLAVDTPWNAFPSLHAGLTVICLLHARRVFVASLAPLPRALLDLGALAWGAAIAFGALASKQHWAIDLAAGAALGALAHQLAVRPRRAEVK